MGARQCVALYLLCVQSVCSCECAPGFGLLTPRLPGWAPTSQTHFAGEGPAPPAPNTRPAAVQRPGSHRAGGLSPFSVSLPRAGVAASFIPSQRPGPPGLLCQSFCGRGKPYFLSSRKPRGPCRDVLLVRGHCSSSRTGERHSGDSTPEEKKAEGSLTEGQRAPSQETLYSCSVRSVGQT